MSEKKSVIIVDDTLPIGIIANTIAYLSVTLGQRLEHCVRPDVVDSSGGVHAGMAEVVLPILQASRDELKQVRDMSVTVKEVLTISFSNAAQSSTTYEEYTLKIAKLPVESLHFLGVALHGPKKTVNKLTGQLSLLR